MKARLVSIHDSLTRICCFPCSFVEYVLEFSKVFQCFGEIGVGKLSLNAYKLNLMRYQKVIRLIIYSSDLANLFIEQAIATEFLYFIFCLAFINHLFLYLRCCVFLWNCQPSFSIRTIILFWVILFPFFLIFFLSFHLFVFYVFITCYFSLFAILHIYHSIFVSIPVCSFFL